jgi:hypothetical protein
MLLNAVAPNLVTRLWSGHLNTMEWSNTELPTHEILYILIYVVKSIRNSLKIRQ